MITTNTRTFHVEEQVAWWYAKHALDKLQQAWPQYDGWAHAQFTELEQDIAVNLDVRLFEMEDPFAAGDDSYVRLVKHAVTTLVEAFEGTPLQVADPNQDLIGGDGILDTYCKQILPTAEIVKRLIEHPERPGLLYDPETGWEKLGERSGFILFHTPENQFVILDCNQQQQDFSITYLKTQDPLVNLELLDDPINYDEDYFDEEELD